MTDLQRRILFTLGVLAVYRLGSHIPVPGIHSDFLARLFRVADPVSLVNDEQIGVSLLNSISIFSLGIAPYLTAAVLMRLASAISRRLRDLENRTLTGRRKIVRVSRLLAVLVAGVWGLGLANGLDAWQGLAIEPGPVFRLGVAATVTTGFVATLWLSDQITRRGIGNGVALILFADIVVGLPGVLATYLDLTSTRALILGVSVSLMLFSMAVVAGIVFFERTVRHVWVRYPAQNVGDHQFGGQYASIPLKLNNGGFLPAYIAAWLVSHAFGLMTYLLFDEGGYTVVGWLDWGRPDHPVHLAVSAVLIMVMAYIYTVAMLDPGDFARHLRERGATALDAEPGIETERAFRRLLRGLSLFGGIYLAVIYLMPEAFYGTMPELPGSIGGIGFLIATAVAMDTLADLAHRRKLETGGVHDGEALDDAMATAMTLPDQPRISAKDPSAGGLSGADISAGGR